MLEGTRQPSTGEAVAVLEVALASARQSSFRLSCRCADLGRDELQNLAVADNRTAEDLLDLSGEVEVAMQVIDRAYRRLSIAYSMQLGPDVNLSSSCKPLSVRDRCAYHPRHRARPEGARTWWWWEWWQGKSRWTRSWVRPRSPAGSDCVTPLTSTSFAKATPPSRPRSPSSHRARAAPTSGTGLTSNGGPNAWAGCRSMPRRPTAHRLVQERRIRRNDSLTIVASDRSSGRAATQEHRLNVDPAAERQGKGRHNA